MNKQTLSIPCTGYDIAADWYDLPSTRDILLCFVGKGSTKARNAELIQTLTAGANMSALVLDFSGHGESPFTLSETRPAQHVLEAVAAFDWLRERYPDRAISVMGTSYGGYVAAWLTRFRDFSKLVLRTPAIYEPRDLYSLHANIDTQRTRKIYRADSAAVQQHPLFLQQPVFTGPALVVVHGNDLDVPAATTSVYQQQFAADTYIAKDFQHAMSDPNNPREQFAAYQAYIADWLRATQKQTPQ